MSARAEARPDAPAPLLSLRGVTKRFPGVVANDAVSFDLRAGEILGLLGENGAGKSTLISILYGLYRPDAGELVWEGRPARVASPAQALKLGIGLVPQHPLLIERHTVAENLALGAPGAWLPARRIVARVRELSGAYGLNVDPLAPVSTLSPGEQQRVEIVRALLGGARVLILDEATSVLTPQEAESLFGVMRALRADGKGVIFISHKLDEVLSVCDRAVVLRRGRVVGVVDVAGASKAQLAQLMVGREVNAARRRETAPSSTPLLEVRNLSALSARGLPAVRGVSFDLFGGEILGVAGIAGNGQGELVEVLAGVRRAAGGELRLAGEPLTGNAARRFARGVAHIPEDRLRAGSVPTMSVAENLALRDFARAPLARGPWRDVRVQNERARDLVARYAVATPGVGTPLRSLSGGNIQKLIFARELLGAPKVVLAVHPSYGLDVGATEQLHAELLACAARGAGVLLVSEDLDELLLLSDRVAVMAGGELRGPFPAREVTREQLGLLMTGGR